MREIRFSLYCDSGEREIGRGWKLNRQQLPEAIGLLMRCISGRWRGRRTWEVHVYAMDRQWGMQVDFTGMRWTDEQRKWFERHMKKLLEAEDATNS